MNRQMRRAQARAQQAQAQPQDEFDRDLFAATFKNYPLTAENLIRYALNNVDESKYGCSAPAAIMLMFQRVLATGLRDMASAFEDARRVFDTAVWTQYARAFTSLYNVFAAVCLRTTQEQLTPAQRRQLLLGWAQALPKEDACLKQVTEMFATLPEGESPVTAFYVGGFDKKAEAAETPAGEGAEAQ